MTNAIGLMILEKKKFQFSPCFPLQQENLEKTRSKQRGAPDESYNTVYYTSHNLKVHIFFSRALLYRSHPFEYCTTT
jgi:hypothetical protein